MTNGTEIADSKPNLLVSVISSAAYFGDKSKTFERNPGYEQLLNAIDNVKHIIAGHNLFSAKDTIIKNIDGNIVPKKKN